MFSQSTAWHTIGEPSEALSAAAARQKGISFVLCDVCHGSRNRRAIYVANGWAEAEGKADKGAHEADETEEEDDAAAAAKPTSKKRKSRPSSARPAASASAAAAADDEAELSDDVQVVLPAKSEAKGKASPSASAAVSPKAPRSAASSAKRTASSQRGESSATRAHKSDTDSSSNSSSSSDSDSDSSDGSSATHEHASQEKDKDDAQHTSGKSIYIWGEILKIISAQARLPRKPARQRRLQQPLRPHLRRGLQPPVCRPRAAPA
jgi:hypothetical protein